MFPSFLYSFDNIFSNIARLYLRNMANLNVIVYFNSMFKILRMYNGTLTNFTLSKLTTGYIITLEVVLASMSLGK